MIPLLSYLVLDYNPNDDELASRVLEESLSSLYANKNPSTECEVIVISQQVSEKHVLFLEALRARMGFSLALTDKNMGISRAINLFSRMARGRFLCLITSDCLFTKGLDDDAMSKMSGDRSVFQVSPLSNASDITRQVFVPFEPFGSPRVTVPGGPPIKVITAELSIRFYDPALFQEIGYYDERWKACYEERDFCLRAFMRERYTIISRDSFCWHYHHMTTKNKSIDLAYKGYLESPKIDHNVLRNLWDDKWPGLKKVIPDIENCDFQRGRMAFPGLSRYESNIYLPYVQKVGY